MRRDINTEREREKKRNSERERERERQTDRKRQRERDRAAIQYICAHPVEQNLKLSVILTGTGTDHDVVELKFVMILF